MHHKHDLIYRQNAWFVNLFANKTEINGLLFMSIFFIYYFVDRYAMKKKPF